MENNIKGIVLICDQNGMVEKIERDDFAVPLNPPFLFTRILEKSSIPKGLSFLAELRNIGTTFNWELVLNLHEVPEVLFFSGGVINDRTFIVGAENSQETRQLFEELMKITNEQATTIRNMIKDQRSETAAYDEISRLNNELVTIQREMAKKNQVDITALVQDIIRINKPLAEQHDIALELQAEQIGHIYTDPGKISQILNNLISNAIKFSKSNTIIKVRLINRGENFTLEVQDQGKGMSLEQQEQLFKPFHKGERGLRGEKTTGLGLTIVKRIIDALGGELRIASQVGEGSTFSVTLPKIPKELQDN